MALWTQDLLIALGAVASLGWLYVRHRRKRAQNACGCDECPAAQKLVARLDGDLQKRS